MKVTILGSGTSHGIPVIGCDCSVCKSTDPKDKRLRCSAMLSINGVNIVIDVGPDFRQQMLREDVHDVRAVLLTHAHRDHIGGLDDLRCFNYKQKGRVIVPMPIFANADCIEHIKHDFSYAFGENRYPGVPIFNLNEVSTDPFYIDNIKVTPIPLIHSIVSCTGYRIGNFAYLTDVNKIPDSSMKLLDGTEYLVIDALREKPHPSHFSLAEALDAAKCISSLKRVWLTHMCHEIGCHSQIEKSLPQGVHFAYDGEEFFVE